MKFAYKRKNVRYLCLFTLLFFITAVAFGQMNGKTKRGRLYDKFRKIDKEMEEAYDNGELNRVIDLYNKHCRKDKSAKPGEEKKEFKKVKKEIRADIYHWVVLSYIESDQPEMADIYIRRLLVLRRREGTGDYWLSIRDTAEEKYYVAPRLLVGVKLGTNFTFAAPFNRYSILEPAYETGEDNYQKKYKFHFNHCRGTQLGIIIEYALSKNLSLYLQPVFSMLKFQYKDTIYIEHSVQVEENQMDSFTRESTSRQKLHYLEIPLLLKYRLGRAKLKPYVQIGGFLSIMKSASKMMSIKTTEVIGQYEGSSTVPVKDIPIKDHITRSNGGFCVGAGIDYDAGQLRLGIEINYKYLLGNIVNKNNRGNKDIVLGYYDVFDDISIRNLEISLKLLLPISFKAFRN